MYISIHYIMLEHISHHSSTLGSRHLSFQRDFQVPKTEVLNLIRLFFLGGYPLHKPYIGVHTSMVGTWNVWWWNGGSSPRISVKSSSCFLSKIKILSIQQLTSPNRKLHPLVPRSDRDPSVQPPHLRSSPAVVQFVHSSVQNEYNDHTSANKIRAISLALDQQEAGTFLIRIKQKT